ncbi:MAG: YlxR family protein [Selenomonadaceae bacterium]|nr:YlxR family protein [Selenomonadaceae bacterium]
MIKKVIELRTCIACRTHKHKSEFIRIVRDTNGNFSIDSRGKIQGHGAYLCKNLECLKRAKKSHGLDRAFKSKVDSTIYDAIESILQN